MDSSTLCQFFYHSYTAGDDERGTVNKLGLNPVEALPGQQFSVVECQCALYSCKSIPGSDSKMVRRLSASLVRVTVATGEKMLTRRLSRVSPFEVVYSKSHRLFPVAALADVQRWASSCSDAPSPSRTSLGQPIDPYTNFNQCSQLSHNFSSRRGWYLSRDGALSCPLESKGISTSKLGGVIHECCGFATAAMYIEDPGKHWRGRGWHPASKGELQADPSIASQFDAIPDLEEKLKFLDTSELRDSQLEQMRKRLPSAVKNAFLNLPVKKLIEVATFMEEEVGVERKDFCNILFAAPFIAGSRVDDCLRPKIAFLRTRGISKKQMGKMVLRFPQILTYSLEGKLLATEKRLLEVGLKGDEIGRIFMKHPAAVFNTSSGKFHKSVQSLRDGGITDVAKAIIKLPPIIGLRLDSQFERIMHFLRDELKLQQEQVIKIVNCRISLLSLTVEENIRPKVGFFSDMGLKHEEIARLVVRNPNVFCHSLDNSLKPKVEYLLNVMNLEVIELISFPHYLGYSLQARIIPRHEHVAKYGLSFKLNSLLSCSDVVFHKRYPKPLYSELEESTPQISN